MTDAGIYALWYDLAPETKDEYIAWLHGTHLPAMLQRHGYLWAAHVENVTSADREARNANRLTHTSDASVPDGFEYLLLYGAENAHVLADPSPAELLQSFDARTREMLARQLRSRECIFVEVERVDGPDTATRRPGITPGPVIQLGTFNSNTLANETEMSTWYSRSRLPLVQDAGRQRRRAQARDDQRLGQARYSLRVLQPGSRRIGSRGHDGLVPARRRFTGTRAAFADAGAPHPKPARRDAHTHRRQREEWHGGRFADSCHGGTPPRVCGKAVSCA